jgi:hypothetical protein
MKKLLLAVPLAAVLAVSMVVTPTAANAYGGFAEDSPDFDITKVKNFSMTVAGEAGGTVPTSQREVFAYVFVLDSCSTDLCAYAVTSHFPEDSTEVDSDIEWHAHYVELTDGCVSLLEEDGNAKLSGNKVSVTDASGTVVAGVTAILSINSGQGAVCLETVIDSQSA